jgi:hypothetical protein
MCLKVSCGSVCSPLVSNDGKHRGDYAPPPTHAVRPPMLVSHLSRVSAVRRACAFAPERVAVRPCFSSSHTHTACCSPCSQIAEGRGRHTQPTESSRRCCSRRTRRSAVCAWALNVDCGTLRQALCGESLALTYVVVQETFMSRIVSTSIHVLSSQICVDRCRSHPLPLLITRAHAPPPPRHRSRASRLVLRAAPRHVREQP